MSTIFNDDFTRYYSEKIWDLIPAIYRHEGGLADPPDVLRALVEVIAGQAGVLRDSQDRLWEDQYIDTCADWAVPYIAELMATRLLSAQNKRGRRIDVAKTIYYRRRKGTPRILEELISDTSNWKGKLVEAFRLLARTRHFLDPYPARYAGRFTATPPGGTADLRNASGSELSGGPFDEFFYSPDMRKPSGKDGRYGISKLNFHIFRLVSFGARRVTPFSIGSGEYCFDPSGRDIPLFVEYETPGTDAWENWQSPQEWELPLPIRCRLLGQVIFRVTARLIPMITADDTKWPLLHSLAGLSFNSEPALRSRLSFLTASDADSAVALCLIEDCGKFKLWPTSLSLSSSNVDELVPRDKMIAANRSHVVVDATKVISVDAESGRFVFIDGTNRADLLGNYHYGLSGPVGAGFYYRPGLSAKPVTHSITAGPILLNPVGNPGLVRIENSITYQVSGNADHIKELTLQAANRQRPYIELTEDWIFSTGPEEDACLTLDGLWIGASAAGPPLKLIFRGDFECILIRNCTIDPGGGTNAKGQTISALQIELDGSVENIRVQNSITGPIVINGTAVLDEKLTVRNSIIQSPDATQPAVTLNSGWFDANGVTIFGGLTAHRAYVTDSIISGIATVTDTQTGCFRFSAAPAQSRVPRPYESFLIPQISVSKAWFSSSRFGNPGYGQLSEIAPKEIQRGAEDGNEMGVFHFLMNASKSDGLIIKTEEFMPFGLIPAYIKET
jgi:hypothetical protein